MLCNYHICTHIGEELSLENWQVSAELPKLNLTNFFTKNGAVWHSQITFMCRALIAHNEIDKHSVSKIIFHI